MVDDRDASIEYVVTCESDPCALDDLEIKGDLELLVEGVVLLLRDGEPLDDLEIKGDLELLVERVSLLVRDDEPLDDLDLSDDPEALGDNFDEPEVVLDLDTLELGDTVDDVDILMWELRDTLGLNVPSIVRDGDEVDESLIAAE